MKHWTLAAAALGAAFFMAGCAVFDRVVEPAASVIARGIDEACEHGMTPLALEARREIVAEINGQTTIGNHTPSDCDGDGLPDFEIDAEGLPVPVSALPPAAASARPPARVEWASHSPAPAAPGVAAIKIDPGIRQS